MKAIILVVCLLGFTFAQGPPNPKLQDQFTCTKCNVTVEDWWYGTSHTIAKYWLDDPAGLSRRDYLLGKTPTSSIQVNESTCFITDTCSCFHTASSSIFWLLNQGFGSFMGYQTILGIKCEIWAYQYDSGTKMLWMTPKGESSGFNTPVRYYEALAYGDTTIIDFLQVEYGTPDPSVFKLPAGCRIN